MKLFFVHFKIILTIVILLIGYGVFHYFSKDTTPDWVTERVTRGEVAQIVSVSGVIEAENEASISFPATGVVREIFVTEGQTVQKDETLATLEQDELAAERSDAYGGLLIAQANRDELIRGPRNEVRDVTSIAVDIARADLERTTLEEAEKVRNAYRALLSNDLEALPIDRDSNDIPPRITGTYTCGKEGVYTFSVFRSGSQSGYSYRLEGLETGSFTAFTEAASPLGLCGLSIQFEVDEIYSSKAWEITIPNTRSSTFTTLKNAYTLAFQQHNNRVSESKQALEKALSEQILENAVPRDEALSRADAAVLQAEARVRAIDARINERILRAPFVGVVSNVGMTIGEVSAQNSITLVGASLFELTVRIPEIDITKIQIGQRSEVVFDARPKEVVSATVGFISSTATEIDGVAYFEAKLTFNTPPEWFRSGLNADVNIIVEKQEDVLRIPKRFLKTNGESYSVDIPNGTASRTVSVQVSFTGNDGFVALESGLNEGDTIIAP